MPWPGQPQSQQERHWTNCQHDLHTSCQQHLGCSVKEWWVTDVLGNATICPFLKYIPSETMHLNGCHGDTFSLEDHTSVLMFRVAITNAEQCAENKCNEVTWADRPLEGSLSSVIQYKKENGSRLSRAHTGNFPCGDLHTKYVSLSNDLWGFHIYKR